MATVLLIGASRGIGLELARQYREAGWRVIATARSPAAVATLQQDRGRLEGRVSQLSASLADVTSRETHLQAHDQQRRRDAALLQSLAAQLQHKAAAVDEAHAAAQAAAGGRAAMEAAGTALEGVGVSRQRPATVARQLGRGAAHVS